MDEFSPQTAGILRVVKDEHEHEPILRARHRDLGDTFLKTPQLSSNFIAQTWAETQLIDKKFVIDSPVPKQLSDQVVSCPGGSLEDRDLVYNEFSHCRYTAATCDAESFEPSGYKLRPLHYRQPRRIEICIVITVYNEDQYLLARSLQTVFENVKHLCSREDEETWGKDSWKNVVVCIIGDGVDSFNLASYSLLSVLGLYQEYVAVSAVAGAQTTAHIYEVCLYPCSKASLILHRSILLWQKSILTRRQTASRSHQECQARSRAKWSFV